MQLKFFNNSKNEIKTASFYSFVFHECSIGFVYGYVVALSNLYLFQGNRFS